MTPEIQALFDRYGSQANIARAFSVTPASVIKWVRSGRLPPLRRYQWRDMVEGPRKTAGEPLRAPPAAG